MHIDISKKSNYKYSLFLISRLVLVIKFVLCLRGIDYFGCAFLVSFVELYELGESMHLALSGNIVI